MIDKWSLSLLAYIYLAFVAYIVWLVRHHRALHAPHARSRAAVRYRWRKVVATLARLEAEMPKLLKDAGGYLPYAADVLPDPGEADHVRGIVQRIDDLLYGTNLAGMNPSRLDAAPKEGS